MRRHARSEGNRKIHRRIRGSAEDSEEGARAEIGSRVFPFRTPPPAAPASMPTAGTRRSTRVFVKSGGDAEPRVLRSGRQVSAPKPRSEWMKVLDSTDGDGSWWKTAWTEPEMEKEKKFGVVYSRKRRRSSSSSEIYGRDRKFGIVFSRKHKRREQIPSPLAVQPRVNDDEVSSSKHDSSPELAVLIESWRRHSTILLARIIVPILSLMMSVRVRFRNLAAFLSYGSIANTFSANGVHFMTVGDDKNDTLARNMMISGCGFCKIYGARKFTPLISLNFSATPVFFYNLHASRNFASFRLSGTLFRELIMGMQVSYLVPNKECDLSVTSEALAVIGTEFLGPETPAFGSNGLSIVLGIPALFPRSSVTVNGYASKSRKHQKKRSSLKKSRTRKPSVLNSRFGLFGSYQNSACVSSESKLDLCGDPVHVKTNDTCLRELYGGRDESDVPSSPGSSSKRKSLDGKKSPIEKIKELRSALAEVRQNIDSARCKANILVTDADRCWREDGAEVMLEMSDPQEWFIVVKRQGLTRYLHKPQDLKPCVVNRFTHAYMWSGDDRWKLEFCNKWDWYVFKEFHMECRERNIQDLPIKIIPVPGVREVSGYEDDTTPSFLRPDMYIHMLFDEVGRALASKVARYDMDSEDEEWLRLLNSSSSSTEGEAACSSCISEENFEKIIFTLERDVYVCADDPYNKERALDLCEGLGRRDIISVVYDYWLKKRKQVRTALVRDFQGPPLRRTQLLHKPFLRKKRSFKRQRSQVERSQAGRGKPVFLLQAEQEAQKVKETESAVDRAAEAAIKLRTRAQVLITNADLAVYKSTMALRIAESIHASSSVEIPDIKSSVLFD